MDRLAPILLGLFLVAFENAPTSVTKQSTPAPATLESLLEKVGQRVKQTNDEIVGLAWTETIVTEELDEQLRPKSNPKEYRYDALVVRQKTPDNPNQSRLVASRELKSVDGKPTSQSDLKAGKCRDTNPSPVYGIPLSFLLPAERSKYNFAVVGDERSRDGRPLIVVSVNLKLELQPPSHPEASVEGGCFHLVGIPSPDGRIWIDTERQEVVRLTWQQPKPIEFSIPRGVNRMGPLFVFRPGRQLRLEKQESRTSFERVSFEAPEQTILMPNEQQSLTLINGARSPGMRVTVKYSQFKRFLTDVRVRETQ